nr:putative ABC transporter permease [Ruminococcus sp.]
MYWIELLWYFIITSFLGWLFSCIYNFFNEKKFYNKGFLTLPFSPTYGASAVLCYLVFNQLSDHLFIMYIGTTLLLSFFFRTCGTCRRENPRLQAVGLFAHEICNRKLHHVSFCAAARLGRHVRGQDSDSRNQTSNPLPSRLHEHDYHALNCGSDPD